MKKVYVIIFSIVFIGIFSFTGCAKRGTISGGPKDTIPPTIVLAHPNNFTTNFDQQEVKIVFSELIKVKDINKQLIISPPLKNKPTILPQGSASKFISVKIKDTLQPNTTYSFNFGQSITDNNEGNPYSQFKYVFSTGSYIDSLALRGTIKDAYNERPENFVSIQLYDAQTFTDSTVYKEQPLYITNTLDSLIVFSLENLKAGEFFIIALKDNNSNYKFDPKYDKIGFLQDKISVPTDTLYELELFKEKTEFKAEKPYQQTNNKLFMGYEGNPRQAIVTATDGSKNIPLIMTEFPKEKTDSVQLFMPLIKADSLVVTVENGAYKKVFTTKIKEKDETDSLQIKPITQGTLHFRDTFAISTATPLKDIKKEFITLLNKDSIAVDFDYAYNEFNQKVKFTFKKEENQKYQIVFLPNAFEDIYATKNDTLRYTFLTKAYSDYGNLRVNLKSVKRFPLILQVLNTDNKVIASGSSTGAKFLRFDALKPNVYKLRVIYDDNGNGVWDTGNYLKRQQAEEIEYYPKEIDVRANWDVEQVF